MAGVVGVVAEYNPFHNGHLYQLQQIKEMYPGETIVVAMSGNFLQRGEPACLDKWTRTRQAISNGADLVIELPVLACVQPADRFADGAVSLLAALGATRLVFGAEHQEYDFQAMARQVHHVHGQFHKYDESYARSFQAAITREIGHPVDQPNDLLGLAYAKANYRLGEPLELVPIQRVETSYHDETLHQGAQIASASAIRKNFADDQQATPAKKELLAPYLPADSLTDLLTERFVSWDDFFPLLRYRLLSSQIPHLHQIYGMTEGIEYRLQEQTQRLPGDLTFEQWVKKVKTKRFTYTHLARLAVAVLLNISGAEVKDYNQAPYVRLLGFDRQGREQLAMVKKTCPFPIYSRVSQDDKKKQLAVDYRAGKIYQLFNGSEQDLKRAPLYFN